MFTGTSSIYISASMVLAVSGLTIPRLVCTTAGTIIQITGDTLFSNQLTVTGTAASPIVIKSNLAGTKRKLTLLPGCTQDLGFCNPTDINSNDGLKVFSYKGALTNTDNWTNVASTPVPFYYAF